ncbi:hypothetical protein WICMUC_004663 [Wickerhamomyces mucosus]|uniref:Hydroxymethylglutaryl-CoA synthase n=1 Tax=Wickerhamomyces mucosus TaxID=1378264 RepID=A0A9P8PG79_9ASCO|nr:hypothetical protein WICMUC_004663 [Wickerhamomyces mucosus]
MSTRPQNVGIKAIEVYIPRQVKLEKADGVSQGKYTIGLGQTNMSFVNDREDIYSFSLTVLSQLIKKNNIDVNNIGRLECGTETLLDKSKSVKTILTTLFGDNHDIEGVDNINACYGGSAAVFNSINWVESSSWDGRDAIVVAGDIALYEPGPARPTGGAGAVALLIGPDAPLVFDSSRGSYFDHVYDFYKANFKSEYPLVDGHFSLSCYVKALDYSYASYSKKAIKSGAQGIDNNAIGTTDRFDYNAFHVPNAKLVAKSYARLLYNDFRANPSLYPEIDQSLATVDYDVSLTDKNIEKTFVGLSKKLFAERVSPALIVPTNTGNMYTASVWGSLASLLYFVGNEKLQNKRIGLFSYGSGLAATLFSIQVKGDISSIAKSLDLDTKLNDREIVSPEAYLQSIDLREQAYGQKDYKPKGSIDHLREGTYYLTEITEKFHRHYEIK